ncbi:MAG: amidohydrolase family protein [Actinobacteria bacterium]|nr:amidohydrolase family protein [Actinomycetota bacterium]MBV8395028.1 amidohydrolase family protein [Actinomycetota bacterium]MBV8599605.1 amidohydrolase family protein [Actinomycetota bacterium]
MSELSAGWVLPVDGPPIENGRVVWEDGRIVEVGPGRAARHLDDAVILPGFVNAHSHLEYAVYAGFGDGLPFARWLLVHMERKARIGLPEMEAIARLGAAECLTAGITTVGDCSFTGVSAPACAELGLRAIVYLEVFSRDGFGLERFEENRPRVDAVANGLVRLGVSPHAPYTVGLDLYREAYDLGLPVATHLNESRDELDWLADGTGPWQPFGDALPKPLGRSGIRALAAEGLLRPGLVAAHCVVVDAEEVALLAEHDVAVVHCPRSNSLLGCGTAPLAELRAAGLRVAVGTDSPASTPSFDMFEEMRTAVYLARARERNPEALGAEEALALATIGGARALGLEGEIGTLTPGKRADLTVLSLAGSPYHPVEDPAAAVVFGGSPERVLETVVDGVTRYRQGEDAWHEVRSTASAARARLLAP